MKEEDIISYLTENTETFLSGNHLESERDKTLEVLKVLWRKVSNEALSLVFKSINDDSDPYLLQSLPPVLEVADKDAVIAEISKLLKQENECALSEGVNLAWDFLSVDYIGPLQDNLSRKVKTVDEVDGILELLERLEQKYDLKIETEIPEWYQGAKEEENKSMIEHQMIIAIEDASAALFSKQYDKAITILLPYEKLLDKSALNKLSLARKMSARG